MHGTGKTWSCKNKKCNHIEESENVLNLLDEQGTPRCPECGKQLRPDIILYGEALDEAKLYDATCAVSRADVLVVCGTSLTVYPVASLPDNFYGYDIIVINEQPTNLDEKARLVFREDIGRVLSEAVSKI